ncbi:MAG TPA: hypothetical protein VMH39_08770 [Gemmatimonadaceae bacterium]|nr:hypothetical protein [Gemmatimonadaceae bacterium]
MTHRVLGAALVSTTLAAATAAAQAKPAAIPPIRPLGPIVRVSSDNLDYIASIRVLSDGRVLVNDSRGKRVVLFDSSLTHLSTVADTTGATTRAYGASGGWLFPFTGDSSLFADNASLSFLVIDPAGKIGRVMAAPRGSGGQLAYLSTAFVDPQGRVVSRQTAAAAARMGGAGRAGAPGVGGVAASSGGARGGGAGGGAPGGSGAGGVTLASPDPNAPPVVTRDSTVILRVDIETKKMDSATWLMSPPNARVTVSIPGGGFMMSVLRNPMPASDAWTMIPDGTIAAVREHDYHVDWIAPDGAVTSTPKIAHEWTPVTDSMKAAILDSVQRADSASMIVARARLDSMTKASGRGNDGTFIVVDGVGLSSSGGPAQMPRYMDPDELPSYAPPFPQSDTLGASPVRADADGNLWIRVNLPKRPEGGFVYDVVNRHGTLVDRIQIPGGTNLIGFGPGVAYLISREGAGYKLARARIR